jgi:hypothetical protein
MRSTQSAELTADKPQFGLEIGPSGVAVIVFIPATYEVVNRARPDV